MTGAATWRSYLNMKRFSDIVDDLGGAAPFAALLGIPESHARTIKARDSIPPEHWPRVVEAARERGIDGVTFEALSEMRSARFKPEPAERGAA